MARGALGNRGLRRGPLNPYKNMGMLYPPPLSPPTRIFDFTLCASSFPRVNPAPPQDEVLQNAVMKQVELLTPTAEEHSDLNLLISEVQKVFDSLICSPGTFAACQVEESRQVGSLKKGTILQGKKVADVVVVYKTLPFLKSIEVLAIRVMEGLKKVKELDFAFGYEYKVTEEGFDITGKPGMVKVRIATLTTNYSKLDPTSHLPLKVLERHAAAIKHCRWFEENCQSQTVKNIVRLIKHMKNCFEGFSVLSPWTIDLLANYVVMNTPDKEPLSEGAAFRRLLQLLSAGLFLQGSSGIPDPCDKNKRLHLLIPSEKQDILCLTAQSLLRILSHGGPMPIFNGKQSIVTSTTMWKGVIVNPLDKAYEKPAEKEESEAMDIAQTDKEST